MPDLEDKRLARIVKICLAFPEATCEYMGQHASFRVRKKIFAYYLNDHHGDGIVSICCKVLPNDNKALAAADPARFYLPAYIGPRGWVGLRLDVGKVDWQEVGELAAGSYHLVAPKELAQNGARRGPVSGSIGGARRTLCASKKLALRSGNTDRTG